MCEEPAYDAPKFAWGTKRKKEKVEKWRFGITQEEGVASGKKRHLRGRGKGSEIHGQRKSFFLV